MRRHTTVDICPAEHRHDPDRPRQSAPGLRLCPGCLSGVRRHLADLPWLHREVVASMPTQRRAGGAPVSGTREPGIPVNLPAGELASQIRYDLYAMCTWVATDRGLHLPADGRVPAVCEWLTRHVDWLAASQYAAEVRGVLTELVGAAYRVIDPDRRPLKLGPCVELVDGEICEGTLRASVLDVDDPRPSKIWCDGCTLELTPQQWFRFGRKYHERAAKIARDQQKQERIAS